MLAKQINTSYEQNLFDGCAVLMRRLIEVLLILTYHNFQIESAIQNNDGSYISLNNTIADAKSNMFINLSKTTKSCIDKFRMLGNFSAHEIYYNARRADIEKVQMLYRVAVEELLYKAGIKS